MRAIEGDVNFTNRRSSFHEEEMSCDSPSVPFTKDRVNHPFKLKVKQMFHGPAEMILYDRTLTFSYDPKNMKGCATIGVFPYNSREKHLLKFSFTTMEQITFHTPPVGGDAVLSMCFYPTRTSHLFKALLTSQTIQNHMNQTQSTVYAASQIIFLLCSWDENPWNFVRKGKTDQEFFYESYREIPRYIREWVIPSRRMDIRSPINNTTSKFFVQLESEDFKEYLDHMNLYISQYDGGSSYIKFNDALLAKRNMENPKITHKTQVVRYSSNGHAGQRTYYPNNNVQVYPSQNRVMMKPNVPRDANFLETADWKSSESFITPSTSFESHEDLLLTQASVPDVPPPVVRKSSKGKRTVETIALEDDDETAASSDASSAKKIKTEAVIGADTVLLKYPPTGRDSLTIHFEDLRVLAHNEMLNDTIVEFFTRNVVNRFHEENGSASIHVFNTFFYPKLIEKIPNYCYQKSKRAASARFEWVRKNFVNVKSWTKKVDIFDKDYLVIPVNDEMHWYAVVVIKPALAILETSDENPDESRRRGYTRKDAKTFILILDSLHDVADQKRNAVSDVIRDYLECEFEDKKKHEGTLVRGHMQPFYPKGLPRQKNYVDCGLYLLGFLDIFLQKPASLEELGDRTKTWDDFYPFSEIHMKFMRNKVLLRIKSLCSPKIWEQLTKYEKKQGRGASVLTDEALIDMARRPRRHSCSIIPRIKRNDSYLARSQSEPPDRNRCAPPGGVAAAVKNQR